MTQWEQLKNEYRDVTVPVNGQAQMLVTMEKARQKRNNHKKYLKYGSLVAAAMLVLLLLPASMFRMGSKSAAPETAFQNTGGMMFDAVMEESVMEESAVEEGWLMNSTTTADSMAAPEMDMSMEAPEERAGFSEEELEAIRLEISGQLGEDVVIDNSIEYYINEEGLYVIVFEAGEIAPEEQGVVEFVIPVEVVSP